MLDDTYAATLDAVARFTDHNPVASSAPNAKNEVASALWKHCPKVRTFEGHKRDILAISLAGNSHLEQLVDGRRVWRGYAPGTIVLLRSDQPTDWCIDGAFEMLHVYLNPTDVQELLFAPILSRPFRDPLIAQLGRAAAMALRENCATPRYVTPILEGLQQCFVDRYSDVRNQARSIRGGLTARVMRNVEEFINENLDKGVCVEELSRIAKLSNAHFNRAFRDSFGTSPHQYIIEQRISKAAHILLTTDLPVSEISRQTGFVSTSHLGLQFKKHLGSSPMAYRRCAGAPTLKSR